MCPLAFLNITVLCAFSNLYSFAVRRYHSTTMDDIDALLTPGIEATTPAIFERTTSTTEIRPESALNIEYFFASDARLATGAFVFVRVSAHMIAHVV